VPVLYTELSYTRTARAVLLTRRLAALLPIG